MHTANHHVEHDKGIAFRTMNYATSSRKDYAERHLQGKEAHKVDVQTDWRSDILEDISERR